MANPTTLVSSFDESLAYSGVSSGTWSGVEPIRYDDGLFLESAATNYVKNPSIEVNTSGFNVIFGTLTRDTSEHSVGTASLKYVSAGAANEPIYRDLDETSAGSGETWYFSVDLKGSGKVKLQITEWDGGGSFGDNTSSPITLTGSFVRYEFSTTTDLSGVAYVIPQILTAEAAACTWYADAWMMSRQSTDYFDGASGAGYAWTGTPHESTSTRAANAASVATTGHIAPTSGSLAFRNTRKIDTGAEEIILTVGTVGAATDAMRCGYDATDHPFMEWNSNNAGWQRVTATATVAADTEALLYFDWSGTTIRCSVDNGALDSDTRNAVEGDWGTGDLELVA